MFKTEESQPAWLVSTTDCILIRIMMISIYSGGGQYFSPILIGCSVPNIIALFTSGQKQNGFPFRSGYRRANVCTKQSCGFAKHEESYNVLFLMNKNVKIA